MSVNLTLTRSERQELGINKWIKAKGIGTLVWATGTGKTRAGTMIIQKLLTKKENIQVLIVVPTDALKEQWSGILDSLGLGLNCTVIVINTVVKNYYQCDLLIMDECHRFSSEVFSNIFNVVKYKLILGLTATFERLDGRHEIMMKYCPPIDTITMIEASANGWVSEYKEYQVLIDVDDIDTYKQYNKDFVMHFEYFQFNWDLVMSMIGPNGYKARLAYRDKLCPYGNKEEKSKVLKNIMYHSQGFMRALQNRKSFINNHPKKLEIARKIIQARPFSKIITFSNNIKMAESIGIGPVYSGKDSKKKGRITIDEFKEASAPAILNTIKKTDEGLDVPGLSVAIMLGIDSSKTKACQRLGRVARKEGDKQAEVFNIIINDTVELEWSLNKNKFFTVLFGIVNLL